jgi:hypothetical protein
MGTPKKSMLLSTVVAFLVFFIPTTKTAFANTTITLDQPDHFTTAEGSDVVLDAGDYDVVAADEWLRVTPSEGQAVDALLLEAQVANHEEVLKAPLGVSAQGESPGDHRKPL